MFPHAVYTEGGVSFSPPAYVQRYGAVCDILKDDSRWAGDVKKVVDFGCAELSLFHYLKGVKGVTQILEVDYDEELLERFKTRVEPLFHDHLFQRETPLNVSVLQGSVSDPDYRLIGTDAVVAIELIEHLDCGVFDRLPHNLFGFIQPKLAIVTTPNADFNVLFPNLKGGLFRHYDHRFEWTREQFEDWANNVVSRYPDYTVEFSGLAPGPDGTEHLGCCSQMALFVNQNYKRRDDVDPAQVVEDFSENLNMFKAPSKISGVGEYLVDVVEQSVPQERTAAESSTEQAAQSARPDCQVEVYESPPHSPTIDDTIDENDNEATLNYQDFVSSENTDLDLRNPADAPQYTWDCKAWDDPGLSKFYKIIAEYDYPFFVDQRTREQKILDTVTCKVASQCNYNHPQYDNDEDLWRLPVPYVHSLCYEFEDLTQDELRTLLVESGFDIDGEDLIYRLIRDDASTAQSEYSASAGESYQTAVLNQTDDSFGGIATIQESMWEEHGDQNQTFQESWDDVPNWNQISAQGQEFVLNDVNSQIDALTLTDAPQDENFQNPIPNYAIQVVQVVPSQENVFNGLPQGNLSCVYTSQNVPLLQTDVPCGYASQDLQPSTDTSYGYASQNTQLSTDAPYSYANLNMPPLTDASDAYSSQNTQPSTNVPYRNVNYQNVVPIEGYTPHIVGMPLQTNASNENSAASSDLTRTNSENLKLEEGEMVLNKVAAPVVMAAECSKEPLAEVDDILKDIENTVDIKIQHPNNVDDTVNKIAIDLGKPLDPFSDINAEESDSKLVGDLLKSVSEKCALMKKSSDSLCSASGSNLDSCNFNTERTCDVNISSGNRVIDVPFELEKKNIYIPNTSRGNNKEFFIPNASINTKGNYTLDVSIKTEDLPTELIVNNKSKSNQVFLPSSSTDQLVENKEIFIPNASRGNKKISTPNVLKESKHIYVPNATSNLSRNEKSCVSNESMNNKYYFITKASSEGVQIYIPNTSRDDQTINIDATELVSVETTSNVKEIPNALKLIQKCITPCNSVADLIELLESTGAMESVDLGSLSIDGSTPNCPSSSVGESSDRKMEFSKDNDATIDLMERFDIIDRISFKSENTDETCNLKVLTDYEIESKSTLNCLESEVNKLKENCVNNEAIDFIVEKVVLGIDNNTIESFENDLKFTDGNADNLDIKNNTSTQKYTGEIKYMLKSIETTVEDSIIGDKSVELRDNFNMTKTNNEKSINFKSYNFNKSTNDCVTSRDLNSMEDFKFKDTVEIVPDDLYNVDFEIETLILDPHIVEAKPMDSSFNNVNIDVFDHSKRRQLDEVSLGSEAVIEQLDVVFTELLDDERSPTSPLAQFCSANKDGAEMLSDSGYLKSQDSPQSPNFSDSFSNDLITPDKDIAEMVQSTVLECIPENLNYVMENVSSPNSKSNNRNLLPRRKSIGPVAVVETSSGKLSEEFSCSSSMSRPKSLHVCTAANADEAEFKTDLFTITMYDSPVFTGPRNDFNARPLSPSPLPRPLNILERRLMDEYEDDGAVVEQNRPNFLDLRNLEVAVLDHQNNNVDFEGNNIDEDERDMGNGPDQEDIDAANLLRHRMDIHNENHLAGAEHGQVGVDEVDEHGVMMDDEEEEVRGEIVEEYVEHCQGGNYECNPKTILALASSPCTTSSITAGHSPTCLVSTPTTLLQDFPHLEEVDDEEKVADILIDSIEKTLGLRESVFIDESPCCSKTFYNISISQKILIDDNMPSSSKEYSSIEDGCHLERKKNGHQLATLLLDPDDYKKIYYVDSETNFDERFNALSMTNFYQNSGSSESSKGPSKCNVVESKDSDIDLKGCLTFLGNQLNKCFSSSSFIDWTNGSDIKLSDESTGNVNVENFTSEKNVDDVNPTIPLKLNQSSTVPLNNETKMSSSQEISSDPTDFPNTPSSPPSSSDSSRLERFFSTDQNLLPNWFVQMLNENPDFTNEDMISVATAMIFAPAERQAGGDGVGIHSLPSTHSSGHASMSSSTSSHTNHSVVAPMDRPSLNYVPFYDARSYDSSSADSSLDLHLPPDLYQESTADPCQCDYCLTNNSDNVSHRNYNCRNVSDMENGLTVRSNLTNVMQQHASAQESSDDTYQSHSYRNSQNTTLEMACSSLEMDFNDSEQPFSILDLPESAKTLRKDENLDDYDDVRSSLGGSCEFFKYGVFSNVKPNDSLHLRGVPSDMSGNYADVETDLDSEVD